MTFTMDGEARMQKDLDPKILDEFLDDAMPQKAEGKICKTGRDHLDA